MKACGAGRGDSDAASDVTERSRRRPRVLIGFTGSVASIKAAELVASLTLLADVKVVVTAAAKHFLSVDALPLARPGEDVYGDEDEWREWRSVGDPVVHIDLRRWADILLIAPLSANTLAKLANGLCDNLLTCVFRAWDFSDQQKRVLLAPAMNTFMWESPFTRRHLETLLELGGSSPRESDRCWYAAAGRGGLTGEKATVRVIDPVEKVLACGDVGNGAMANVHTITEKVADCALELDLPAPPQ